MPDQTQQNQNVSGIASAVGSTAVPFHKHTGMDSPLLPFNNVSGTFTMTAVTPTIIPQSVSGQLWLDSATGRIYYYDTTNKVWRATIIAKDVSKFGGDGSDGALTITSGTTTIDLANANMVVKQYTSINMSGGTLAFSNPHAGGTLVIIKSQGDVTISGTINLQAMGAAGGTGGVQLPSPTAATNGTNGNFILDDSTHYGSAGAAGSAGTGGAGGAASTVLSNLFLYTPANSGRLSRNAIFIACGSGGGGAGRGQAGNNQSGDGGNGGRGGGALILECGGAFNFTGGGSIVVSGAVGSDGTTGAQPGVSTGGGAGGGGASGMAIVLYNTLTANSGTITASGGAGGTGGSGNAGNVNSVGSSTAGGGGGSGAACFSGAGGAGGNGGNTGVAGANGSNGATGAGGGGGGGGGDNASGAPSPAHAGGTPGTSSSDGSLYLVAKNYYFT